MNKYYSSREIKEKLAIGRSTINKWQQTKDFPRPELVIGNQCNRWNAEQVDQWIERYRAPGN
jgi:predicted DNA-binding transcriptional regulator AlpA